MLIFIGSRRQTYLLRTLKRDERMPPWTTRTYGWLFRTGRLPAGTYIFLGVDRLDHAERRLAAQFYRAINRQGPGFRALNDPARGMDRYRLLRTLHEAGINDFNAYLAAESARPDRYPVFVRNNRLSTKPLTGLLPDRAALDRELDRLIAAGEPDEDLLIIEYCTEELQPGVFVKHAEYRVADRTIANSVLYGGNWYVKYADRLPVDDAVHERDAAIVTDNPHGPVLMRAFELAHIEYGRADFGIVNGRPQIYEINYNPDLRTQRERPRPHPRDRANREIADGRMFEAMRAIDTSGTGSMPSLTTPELTAFRLRFWRNYAPQRY